MDKTSAYHTINEVMANLNEGWNNINKVKVLVNYSKLERVRDWLCNTRKQTVFVACIESDGSYIAICKTEKTANKKAKAYTKAYGNKMVVYEEELHN